MTDTIRAGLTPALCPTTSPACTYPGLQPLPDMIKSFKAMFLCLHHSGTELCLSQSEESKLLATKNSPALTSSHGFCHFCMYFSLSYSSYTMNSPMREPSATTVTFPARLMTGSAKLLIPRNIKPHFALQVFLSCLDLRSFISSALS